MTSKPLLRLRHLALIAALLPGLALADQPSSRFTLKTGAYFTTGDYGRTQSTDIYYVPVTASYATGRWATDLTVPYLRVSGPGNVIPDLGSVRAPSSATTTTTNSGLGDVRASVYYRAYNNPSAAVAIDLGVKAKFGTASRTKGLGTGKNDYAVQAGVQKAFGKVLTAATLGYRWQGSPPGIALRNVAYAEGEVAYRFSPENSVGFGVIASQASTATSSDRLLSTGYYKHAFSPNWTAQAYLLKGFSRSSPDYGGGLSMSYSFVN